MQHTHTPTNRAMRLVGGVVAASLLLILALSLTNRAAYQFVGDPRLREVANAELWHLAFFAAAAGIITSRTPRWTTRAFIWGGAVLASWGGLNLVIGLQASRPISLLGPALTLCVLAPLALVCANFWQTRSEE